MTQSLKLLAGNDPLPVLLDGVTRCLEAVHAGALASILLLDETGERLLFGAAPSLPDFYNKAIDGVVIGPDVGSCGSAAFHNRTVIVEDIQSDPRWENFKDLARQAGLASCWSQPVRSCDGRVLGALALYRRDVCHPSEIDLEAIESAAQLVAIAIERHRNREKLIDNEERLLRSIAEGEETARLLRAAEEASNQQRDFYGKIIEMLPALLMVKDAREGRFVLFNPAAEAATGLVAAEAIGKTMFELFPRDEAERSRAEDLAVARSTEMAVEFDAPVTGPDGRLQFWTTRKVATHNARGPQLIITVGEDVTEQHHARLALSEALVRAEEASIAKSAFLANMSHELRTPLNGIVAAADLLSRSALGARERELVDLVATSGGALTALLSDLLDMSRIEAGAVEIDTEPFDLRAIARSTVELFQLRADEKGISIQLSISEDVAPCYIGDALRIRQIMSNFLSNAVKFTDAGVIHAELSTAPAGAVIYSVRDNGLGFDEHTKDRIFDRFQQADSSITRRFGGTGLGLAICRDLAGLMGGVIDCESRRGEGARFWLEVPLKPIATAGPEPYQAKPVTIENQQLRVLVADDHPTNRKVAELMLSGMAEVVTVENGREAVEAASREVFDLIFMDMQMPVMDGLTAIRTIRSSGSPGRNVPIIMMTANALSEHVQASHEAGANVHLAKPITGESLLDAINQALAGLEVETMPCHDIGKR